ncbi:DUF6705 family protein [Flavobacterium sp.]|uniref:DUF6705 family protein n=1 Tax=Flavobacterium sp. TaxID=239 RepID=UPI0037511151
MKNLIYIVMLFASYSGKSQIINIRDQGIVDIAPGQHYKDVDNLLNPFEGTWVFDDGIRYLKIILVKRINHYNGSYTNDYIYGGYEYKVNNQTLVNTLNDANTIYNSRLKYSIYGNGIFESYDQPICNDCDLNEIRLFLSLSEPASILNGSLIIKKTNVNGQEAIKLNLTGSNSTYYKDGTPPPPGDFVLPSGDYILIKQ